MRLHSHSRCPTPATLAAVADGSLPPSERDTATAHIADCERCLGELAAIVRLGRAPDLPLPASLRKRVSRRPRAAWQTAAAVAATVMIGFGGWWLSPAGTPQRQPALPVAEEAVRSRDGRSEVPLVIHPAPQGRLSVRQVTFSWQPVAAALTYRLRVMRDDGQLVWEGESIATTMRLTDTAALPAAVPLYVAVTAVLPDGRTARAPAVPFTILRE
jgi:hypothetical protein